MAPTSNVDLWSLLVIAWGGMHFLLLCNASPAMCKPTCSDVEYSRTIWIELDSQILNAHLCLTGFGMAIPRFILLLTYYRIRRNEIGVRRLEASTVDGSD